jgi:hypothetical protein
MTATANPRNLQWLNPADRGRLREGRLTLPPFDPAGAVHDVVPVSMVGGGAVWVDTAIAPVVYGAQRYGCVTVDSCQGGQPLPDGTAELAYLAFASYDKMLDFARMVDPDRDWPSREGWSTCRPPRWQRLLGARVCVLYFPPEWLPQMRSNLMAER